MSATRSAAEIRSAAQQMIGGQTDRYLLDTLRHSLTVTDPEIARVQAWIIDELEQRHPELTATLEAWSADLESDQDQTEIVLQHFA